MESEEELMQIAIDELKPELTSVYQEQDGGKRKTKKKKVKELKEI